MSGKFLVAVDVPSKKENGVRFADLPKILEGLRARPADKMPGDPKSYIFKLSFKWSVPKQIALKRYYPLRDRASNLVFNSRNAVKVGTYDLASGILSLSQRGPVTVRVNVPKKSRVFYVDHPRKLNNIANATVRFRNGDSYSGPCSFTFYGE